MVIIHVCILNSKLILLYILNMYRKEKKKKIRGGSDAKESACNVGDPGSITESGRSPGEGNGNSL